MPLRMFSRVEQESQHCRRQSRAANRAGLLQSLVWCCPQLLQRSLHRSSQIGEQRLHIRAWRIPFSLQSCTLRIVQRFAAGVGEQPIGCAGQVQEMKPDAGGAAGCRPELVGVQTVDRLFHILDCLQ